MPSIMSTPSVSQISIATQKLSKFSSFLKPGSTQRDLPSGICSLMASCIYRARPVIVEDPTRYISRSQSIRGSGLFSLVFPEVKRSHPTYCQFVLGESPKGEKLTYVTKSLATGTRSQNRKRMCYDPMFYS